MFCSETLRFRSPALSLPKPSTNNFRSATTRPYRLFLEIPELDVLSSALSMSTPTFKITTRIEAYSTKQVSKERKLFKTLESELIQDLSLSTSVSPPEHHQGLLDSAFGPLDKPQSRKTLWLLIGLLNVAFPDYDFSKVRPESFRREESPRGVLASLSAALDHLRSPTGQKSFSSFPGASAFGIPSSPYSDSLALPGTTPTDHEGPIATNPFLRQVLDPIIDLSECEVYTYTPDIDSDPHAAESDDEDDGEDESFEADDGMAFEMDGVDGHSAYPARPSTPLARFPWSAGSTRSPMKSIASVFPPGTPSSVADSEEYFGGDNGEDSTGGLLWSTFQFLYNRKAKRVVFINAWARTPRESRAAAHAVPSGSTTGLRRPVDRAMSTHLKRSHSASSVASISLNKKKIKA
ncbi:mitogen-activated protein kinase Maf1 [Rhodotorula toruloides]|nr:mitogen-activated protein kinase Maf1 [Rhodotorula toruloides]